jgi:hypothetical protein
LLVPCFSARGSSHAQVSVDRDEPRLVLFDWEVIIPEDGRAPTVALYEDQGADPTPTFLQVCTGEAADLLRQLAQAMRPHEIAARVPALGAMTIAYAIANWAS